MTWTEGRRSRTYAEWRTCLAEQDQTALTRRLDDEIASIRRIRQQRYENGPFLVLVVEASVHEYTAGS